MNETIRRFANLFAGVQHAYGSDQGFAVHRPVTPYRYEQHLMGIEPIGIYPCIQPPDGRLNPTSTGLFVKWGCCDIDTGDWSETWRLYTALDKMGLCPHIERSRSKGWHIWVFASTWVPAATMRRALKVAYKAIGLPAKEANPKSEHLRPSQLGNYVRLPYKGHLGVPAGQRWPDRQVFMCQFDTNHDGKPLNLKDWLGEYTGIPPATVSPETLNHWADKWYEPPRPNLGITSTEALQDGPLAALCARLPRSLRGLWENGPKTAHKRSEGLTALAYQSAQAGFTPDEVFHLVQSADRIWGKYHTREGAEGYILDLVERAFK